MEVRTVAKYNEESDEVEVCSTGSSVVGGYRVSASACGVAELDVDEIVSVAQEAKSVVSTVISAVESSVAKLREAGVEAEPSLIEALAKKAAGDEAERVDRVTVKVEAAPGGGEAL